MRLKIPKITHDEAISAFIKGLRYHEAFRSKLLRKRTTTVAKLLTTATNYADTDDTEKLIREDVRGNQPTDHPKLPSPSWGVFPSYWTHASTTSISSACSSMAIVPLTFCFTVVSLLSS